MKQQLAERERMKELEKQDDWEAALVGPLKFMVMKQENQRGVSRATFS